MADYYTNYLVHHGIKGQKWGVRRYQNADGTLTAEGRRRYGEGSEGESRYARARSVRRIAATGAALAGTALAAYGGYKLYKALGNKKLNNTIDIGKKIVESKVGPSNGDYTKPKTANKQQTALDAMWDEVERKRNTTSNSKFNSASNELDSYTLELLRRLQHSDTLAHHGILGQKWGKRNGPPYPLDSSKHSAAEKKAAINKKLLAGIAMGAGVAIAAAYVAKHPEIVGKVNGIIKSKESLKSGSIKDISDSLTSKDFKDDLPEQLRGTNPHYLDPEYDNNCTVCGIAAFLRMHGINVTAGKTGGPQNLNGVVEQIFRDPSGKTLQQARRVLDGTASTFGKSPGDAKNMLLKRFGSNAEGVVSFQFNSGRGHIINWIIKDGEVSFFDTQPAPGLGDTAICKKYWNKIDSSGALQIARLDGLEVIAESLDKWFE